jgi:sulfatase modifying factor 1
MRSNTTSDAPQSNARRLVWGLLLGSAACASPADSGARLAAASSASPSSDVVEVASTPSASAPAVDASAPAASSAAPSADVVVAAAPVEKPPCPPNMTLVGRFCIDTYEAELEEQDENGEWIAHPYYERPPSSRKFRAVDALGAFPQGYISQKESAAACKESSKRLCTKSEWQRACKRKGYMRYPYGQQAVRAKCNSGKSHLLSLMFKHPAGGITYEHHFNAPELNKEPGWLSKSGDYADCQSDLGVFDMVGNLHEWVSDKVSDDLLQQMDLEDVDRHKQPHAIGNGVFMGGFYSTTGELGPGCLYITVAHEPTYHDYSTGFRCCTAAELPKEPAKPPPPPAKRK